MLLRLRAINHFLFSLLFNFDQQPDLNIVFSRAAFQIPSNKINN